MIELTSINELSANKPFLAFVKNISDEIKEGVQSCLKNYRSIKFGSKIKNQHNICGLNSINEALLS